MNYYQREITREGENPPVGIVLCSAKKEAMVRYTLSAGNTQIFASTYKLYLPTEEELITELQRERAAIGLRQQFDEGTGTGEPEREDRRSERP